MSDEAPAVKGGLVFPHLPPSVFHVAPGSRFTRRIGMRFMSIGSVPGIVEWIESHGGTVVTMGNTWTGEPKCLRIAVAGCDLVAHEGEWILWEKDGAWAVRRDGLEI